MKLLVMTVALVLAACGGDKNKNQDPDQDIAGDPSGEAGKDESREDQAAPAATTPPDDPGVTTNGPAAAAALGGMPAGWIRFELAEHNFAVALPKQPGPPDIVPIPTEAGPSEAKVYMVMAEPYYYGLGVVTMPQALLDDPEPMTGDVVSAAFDQGGEQMLAAVNGTKTGEKAIEVRGLPAREVTYTVSLEGQRVEGLSWMIADPKNKRIYQLQILSDRPVAAASKPFFDSFELLSE